MNMASFWVLVGDNYAGLSGFSVILTLLLCGIGLYTVLHGIKKLGSAEQFMNTAVWFVWTCIFFLPGMHDRYTYLLDVLLVMLAFIDKKYIKYAAVSATLSIMTYGIYLFDNGDISIFYSLVYLASWLHYTCFIIKRDSGGTAIRVPDKKANNSHS